MTNLIDPANFRKSFAATDHNSDEYCFVCYKDLTGKKKWFVHTVQGSFATDAVPTAEEIAEWDAKGSYTGLYPVGSTCAKLARAEGVKVLTARQAGV